MFLSILLVAALWYLIGLLGVILSEIWYWYKGSGPLSIRGFDHLYACAGPFMLGAGMISLTVDAPWPAMPTFNWHIPIIVILKARERRTPNA